MVSRLDPALPWIKEEVKFATETSLVKLRATCQSLDTECRRLRKELKEARAEIARLRAELAALKAKD